MQRRQIAAHDRLERIAALGNAAGTSARGYGHYFPQTKVDGVEIDPELEEVGRRFFDMTNPNLTVYNEDARPWLRDSDGGYDVIIVDTYRQPYIPFYMATREFFELARDRLAPGGMVIVNVGHTEGNDDLEEVLSATAGEVFPNLLRDPVEDSNTLLVASETALSLDRLRRVRDGLPTDLQQRADDAFEPLLALHAGGDNLVVGGAHTGELQRTHHL